MLFAHEVLSPMTVYLVERLMWLERSIYAMAHCLTHALFSEVNLYHSLGVQAGVTKIANH